MRPIPSLRAPRESLPPPVIAPTRPARPRVAGAFAPPTGPLPRAAQLAALGPVLCVHPARPGGQLAGWARAVRCVAGAATDSDGPREWLDFFDPEGLRCWRLYRLPDGDGPAWARLVAGLPHAADAAPDGLLARLWRGACSALREPPRSADVLRLHVAPNGALGASLVAVSGLGGWIAAQLACLEGAGNAARLRERCVAVDGS